MQVCSVSAFTIIQSVTAEYNKQRHLQPAIHSDCWHVPRFTCSHVAQVHRPPQPTSVSADGVVLLLFFVDNNFHSRPHRKVATRHTLPNIQISLSLRKFSMMEIFLLSACTGCLSYLSLSAACGEGVSGGGQQVVDMGRDSSRALIMK